MMPNNSSSHKEEIDSQLERLSEKKELLKKNKQEFDNFLENWQFLQNKEVYLLEEVQSYSQGTHSEQHAINQLETTKDEILKDQHFLSATAEEFDKEINKIKREEDFLQEERQSSRTESEN